MKALGLVFSLLGNIFTFAVFGITACVMYFGVVEDYYSLGLYITLIVLTVVLFVLGTIGNKIQDNLQEGLKVKVVLFRLLARLPAFISLVLSIIGAFILFGGLFFMGAIFDCEPILVFFLGGYLLIGGVLCDELYGGYIKKHCKYCGCSLLGGDYDYEEMERIFTFNSQKNEGNLSSRIKFTFYCPECCEENILYKKMKTDDAVVERFARRIVGRE